MGSQPSKNKRYEEALQLFSNQEVEQIKSLFLKISEGNERSFNEQHFRNFFQAFLFSWPSQELSHNLFHYMVLIPSEGKHDDTVGVESFLITLSRLLKGSYTELAEITTFLATGNSAEKVTVKQLFDFSGHLVHLLENTLKDEEALKTWSLTTSNKSLNRFVKHILHDLIYGDKKKIDVIDEDWPWEQSYCTTDVEQWLIKCPLFNSILHTLFYHIFPISYVEGGALPDPVCLIPKCHNVDWNKTSTLLDLPTMLTLNSSLMPALRRDWRLLFSTQSHGESFHTMTKMIMHQGPSIIIVRDTDGNMFGGFASHSWTCNAQFTGDSNCFLFSVTPALDIFHVTDYNSHFMYLNQGQETLPNGLGMGGQFGYMGLWLDYEFGKGHSKAEPTCTTYGSPQLSEKPEFVMERVEVWAVGPKPTLPDQEGAGSILDKDMEAQAMLSLLDKGPLSDGLREEDPMADTPGQQELPPLS